MSKQGVLGFIGGVGVGLVIGATAVALTTPKTGKDLRDDLRKEGELAKVKIENQALKTKIKVQDAKSEALTAIKDKAFNKEA